MKRYDFFLTCTGESMYPNSAQVVPHPNGILVLYADAQAEIDRLRGCLEAVLDGRIELTWYDKYPDGPSTVVEAALAAYDKMKGTT